MNLSVSSLPMSNNWIKITTPEHILADPFDISNQSKNFTNLSIILNL